MRVITRDPRSPHYVPTKEEKRRRKEKERKREMEAKRLEYLLKQADCRECGGENNRATELCKECEE